MHSLIQLKEEHLYNEWTLSSPPVDRDLSNRKNVIAFTPVNTDNL